MSGGESREAREERERGRGAKELWTGQTSSAQHVLTTEISLTLSVEVYRAMPLSPLGSLSVHGGGLVVSGKRRTFWEHLDL